MRIKHVFVLLLLAMMSQTFSFAQDHEISVGIGGEIAIENLTAKGMFVNFRWRNNLTKNALHYQSEFGVVASVSHGWLDFDLDESGREFSETNTRIKGGGSVRAFLFEKNHHLDFDFYVVGTFFYNRKSDGPVPTGMKTTIDPFRLGGQICVNYYHPSGLGIELSSSVHRQNVNFVRINDDLFPNDVSKIRLNYSLTIYGTLGL